MKIKKRLFQLFVFFNLVFVSFTATSQEEVDPCTPLGQCLNVGAVVHLPDWPLPIMSCPNPLGTRACCTSC